MDKALWIVVFSDEAGDFGEAKDLGDAIAAEKEAVAGLDFDLEDIGAEVLGLADAAGQGMCEIIGDKGIFTGAEAFADLLLHGVIGGELVIAIVAKANDRGITDVGDMEEIIKNLGGGEGGAHADFSGAGTAFRIDPLIDFAVDGAEVDRPVVGGMGVDGFGEEVDGQLTGFGAAGKPAEAVGNGENLAFPVEKEGVLIFFPDESAIGDAERVQFHATGNSGERRGGAQIRQAESVTVCGVIGKCKH